MASEDPTRKERVWKVFFMLPPMLLHRPPRRTHFSQQVVFAFRSIQQSGVDQIDRGQHCLRCPGGPVEASPETKRGR